MHRDHVVRASAYYSDAIGCDIMGPGTEPVTVVESERRFQAESGFSDVWAIFAVHTGGRTWVSVAPGLADAVRAVVTGGMSIDTLANALASAVGREHAGYSLIYLPGDDVPDVSVPDGYSVRPLRVEDVGDGVWVPNSSIEAGAAFGAFHGNDLVSWAEATPVGGGATERFGVHLAGIGTNDGYRRRGLGRAVLASVTRALNRMGRTSVYFCGRDNVGSRRTAESCGYLPYGEMVRITVPAQGR